MKKKYYIWIILLFIATISQAAPSIKDSLQNILQKTKEPTQRAELLINILDLSDSSTDELEIARKLYTEGKKADDKMAIGASLSTLTIHYMQDPEKKDSLTLLLNEAEKLLENSDEEGLATYYKMTYKARFLQLAPREERVKVCNRIQQELNDRKESETSYEKAERLFLTGVIHYLLMAMTENIDYKNALPYWEEGWNLAEGFPPTARKNFTGNLYIMLSVSYRSLKDSKRLMEVSNQYLQRLDEYFSREDVIHRRPYFYKNSLYVLCYQQLMLNHQLIGRQKAHEYYLRYCNYVRHGKGDALLRNKLFFYDLSQSYFSSLGEYPQALAFCDSLIQMVETGKAINTASVTHYKTKAKLLREMGRAEESCQVYDRAMFLADSLTRKEQLGELGEIQVKNEVAQLELEKADIITRIRNIAFYSTILLTFVVIGFTVYLSINLKRTRKLQKELLRQTQKAQESERMQSNFIRSMYNDVHIPLNHINKQTQLIVGTSLSPTQKAECSEQIKESCQQLTSLLDEMLEKAYHESSAEAKDAPPDHGSFI
ncbi:histidine kinase [Bacteroides fragilis]|nr:histidine kinase [Bacteroides fragilis]MCE8677836.1 histidine kinase [Bacteroides fragilis]